MLLARAPQLQQSNASQDKQSLLETQDNREQETRRKKRDDAQKAGLACGNGLAVQAASARPRTQQAQKAACVAPTPRLASKADLTLMEHHNRSRFVGLEGFFVGVLANRIIGDDHKATVCTFDSH